jgi:two-component system CheB/CheR fusion protein
MYFNLETQEQVLGRFHFSLQDDGCLFLGRAETLMAHSALFEATSASYRLFRKVPSGQRREAGRGIEVSFSDARVDIDDTMLALVFETSPVAQVVVNPEGLIVSSNATARALFPSLASGQRLRDLEVSYRPIELRSLIDQAVAEQRVIALRDVPFPAEGEERWIDVEVIPVFRDQRHVAVSLVFQDVTAARRLSDQLQQSSRSLERALEELQSSNEELETTNEELQSTVEELETTNEELQSTNEELETMNEELQSTNEELETVNEELRDRGEQLNALNSFLRAVLGSIQMGVVVVNRDLSVRSWNAGAEDLWGLRSDEAEGSHLLNLDIGFPVERLRQPLRESVAGRGETYAEAFAAVDRRGRPIQCRVSCVPLHTATGEVDGAIIVMDEAPEREQR